MSLQIGGAGQAEEIAHAKEHEAGGHDPEQDVLDAGFHLDAHALGIAAHGHEEVEGKGGELQGDENGDQLDELTSIIRPRALSRRNR